MKTQRAKPRKKRAVLTDSKQGISAQSMILESQPGPSAPKAPGQRLPSAFRDRRPSAVRPPPPAAPVFSRPRSHVEPRTPASPARPGPPPPGPAPRGTARPAPPPAPGSRGWGERRGCAPGVGTPPVGRGERGPPGDGGVPPAPLRCIPGGPAGPRGPLLPLSLYGEPGGTVGVGAPGRPCHRPPGRRTRRGAGLGRGNSGSASPLARREGALGNERQLEGERDAVRDPVPPGLASPAGPWWGPAAGKPFTLPGARCQARGLSLLWVPTRAPGFLLLLLPLPSLPARITLSPLHTGPSSRTPTWM